jgi:thioredoxin 2
MVAANHMVCPSCQALNRVPVDRPAVQAKCGSCHAPLFAGAPLAIDEAGFERHLAKDEIPLLVDMWAPWCGPCRTMAPMFERAAQQLEPQLRLLKLNVDEAQSVAARYGVRGIPALLLFHRGRLLAQSAGVQNTDAIIRWVRANVPAPINARGE